MHQLELRWRERDVGAMETPRRFLDFVVDGDSLYDLLGRDNITPLGWGTPQQQRDAFLQLLGEAPPTVEDRTALYVCAECGDLYCGAVTATIEADEETVFWRDPANTMMDFVAGTWLHDLEPFVNWPELHFELEQYRRVLSVALTEPR